MLPKVGSPGALIESAMFKVEERVPDTAVTVMDDTPDTACAVGEKVNVLEVAVDDGLKDAVTPDGNPAALSDTGPLNPFCPMTEITVVPFWPPEVSCSEETDAARVKPGASGAI